MDRREKVLFEKEKKKRDEQEKVEKALKAIRMENFEARKNAHEKKYSQYRPSDDMVSLIGNGDKKGSSANLNTVGSNEDAQEKEILVEEKKTNENGKKQFKIQEDYEMHEESISEDDEVIEEVDNEEEDGVVVEQDLGKIQEKIHMARDKLTEKTLRISELKQSLRNTKILEKSIIRKTQTNINMMLPVPTISDEEKEFDEEESLDIEFSDEDSTEETARTPNEEDIPEKRSYNPQYFKIQDRIKLLKHRCEAGLGSVLYEKAYKLLQEKINVAKPEEIRKNLIDIFGEDNIGFWHLIDQILLLEDFSKKLQEAN